MKRPSKGTVLSVEVASALTPIAQIESISGPDAEVEEVATPTLDDTNPTIPHDPTGHVEGGTLDFEYYYDPALASHQALGDLMINPAKKDIQVDYVVGDPSTFEGIVKKNTPTAEVGSMLKASGSIQVAGSLVLAGSAYVSS